MDKNLIEKQKQEALKELEKMTPESDHKKQKISVVLEYLSSLTEPEKFTNIQKEDLRKLALELGYSEDTNFESWVKKL